ncbi:hypothetical protein [Lederbergia citri]|uniref:Lipoprotein n=1 Tax=Lederbergia citri TaxID=2833580 RepID=A0A942TH80_9BACI|nr:hypothetical protein [Lederbergia citri]MBS4196542.1 hypothetical protein [Lederbergia citri]
MKKSKVFIVASLLAVLLVGMSACSNSSVNDTSTQNQSKLDNTSQSTDNSSTDGTAKSDNSGENNDNEQASNSSDGISKDTAANSVVSDKSDLNTGFKEDNDTLSHYSSEQIEYARVWLQLGANQQIDGLYARHIPAGTPLNPDDDTSASYPEDVIQLAGSRLVDGSVTYSGNGDGTINVYNVPLRWDGHYPAGENFYIDIITNTKLVYVDPGDDEKIVALIKLLSVQ